MGHLCFAPMLENPGTFREFDSGNTVGTLVRCFPISWFTVVSCILSYTVVVYCDQSHFKVAERWLDTVVRFLLHPIVTMIPQNRMPDTKVFHRILPIWETSIVRTFWLCSLPYSPKTFVAWLKKAPNLMCRLHKTSGFGVVPCPYPWIISLKLDATLTQYDLVGCNTMVSAFYQTIKTL